MALYATALSEGLVENFLVALLNISVLLLTTNSLFSEPKLEASYRTKNSIESLVAKSATIFLYRLNRANLSKTFPFSIESFRLVKFSFWILKNLTFRFLNIIFA